MDVHTSGFILAMITEVIVVVVWLVRQEGRINYIERHQNSVQTEIGRATSMLREDVASLRVKHEALDSKIVEELARVRETLAELKGYLNGSKQEP